MTMDQRQLEHYGQPMTLQQLRTRTADACQSASELVQTWPAWKQNLLEHLAQPTCPARLPVSSPLAWPDDSEDLCDE